MIYIYIYTYAFIFDQQLKFNKKTAIPNIYQIFPDTIGIESWSNENNQVPTNLITDKEIPEVIVDAACGGSVLRGSHVFAPGVMGLSPSKNILYLALQ